MTRQEEIDNFLDTQNQKQTEERIVGQTADASVPYVKQMIGDVAAPSIVKVINDMLVPVKKETLGKQIVGMQVAYIMKDVHEVIMDFSQEPICRRTGEQIFDVVPRVTKDIF